ncbi:MULTISPECIES: tautomerase family protein [unclassified Bradyrhizobium]|uniref:tautomerase family protein n=1 Tax=unclassified Bradyrhizobium TaxID=2631580 RepID=UPI0028EDFDFE|nr:MULTISPECIES: tautomerase family protein [unclassified Bradyrhizobium]
MPFTRVSLRSGKSTAYRHAILEGIYRAQRMVFDVPEDDRFMVVNEHDGPDFWYGADYLGIHRSDDLVMIQMTVSNTRPLAKKKALYREIVAQLSQDPGLRPEDIFINLVEVVPENWSFGNGLAQYASEKA